MKAYTAAVESSNQCYAPVNEQSYATLWRGILTR
jgi:hypothetical protein